jgi:hypothetical protein
MTAPSLEECCQTLTIAVNAGSKISGFAHNVVTDDFTIELSNGSEHSVSKGILIKLMTILKAFSTARGLSTLSRANFWLKDSMITYWT